MGITVAPTSVLLLAPESLPEHLMIVVSGHPCKYNEIDYPDFQYLISHVVLSSPEMQQAL